MLNCKRSFKSRFPPHRSSPSAALISTFSLHAHGQLALFPVNATHLQRAKAVLDNFQIIIMLESIKSQKIQLSSVAYWYVRSASAAFDL